MTKNRLDDEDLTAAIDGARTGSPRAFETLYRHFAPTIRGFARLRGADDPDGLTNEVLLDAFRGLDRFTGDDSGFRAWVFRIARNKLVDEQRRRSRRPRFVHSPPRDADLPAVAGPESVIEGRGPDSLVRSLEALTDDQRDVVVLRFVLDLSIDETAAIVGKPVTAVKALQRRALGALRRNLDAVPVSQPDITTITRL